MNDYKLHIHTDNEIETVEFSGDYDRTLHIVGEVGIGRENVWMLILGEEIYVFDNWRPMRNVITRACNNVYLFKYNTYQEAYQSALEVKQTTSPL